MKRLSGDSAALRARLRWSASRLAVGGDWALSLPEGSRRNLGWFWLDGFFSAACDNIVVTYLTLYVLALGATGAQIGLMSALTNLSAALVLLPGAMLVERAGHRKGLALLGGGGARLALLLLASLPLALQGNALVGVAIALAVSRDAFSNLGFPAWMAITADVVPLEGRGRYFASRNFAMGIAGMVVTLLAGELITRASQPEGYQAALAFAFVFGMSSSFSFSRIQDPDGRVEPVREDKLSLRGLVGGLKAQPGFLSLCVAAAIWNFSLNVAGPFFTVHLVQDLHASAALVGLTSIATSVSSLAAQRWLGELSDRWGAARLQFASSLLIPILPFAWAIITAGWHVILINLLGGALWAAFTLSSFNYLLQNTPDDQRARFSALYQIVVLVSLALGAALGGALVSSVGYKVIFVLSGAGRLVASALFARFAEPGRPRRGEASPSSAGPAAS